MNFKCIIVDVYELSDEIMQQYELNFKNRVTLYNYNIKKLEDFAIPDTWKNKFKIGTVIENWKEFIEGVVEGEG